MSSGGEGDIDGGDGGGGGGSGQVRGDICNEVSDSLNFDIALILFLTTTNYSKPLT